MDSSIWVATTTGLPARRDMRVICFCTPGHALERHLDPEIAARHHQGVGQVEDLVQPGHRLRLLDLGHHHGAPAGDLLGLGDILRPLDERQRHPVDAGVERGLEIGAVLRGQRRERDHGVGQADALAVRQLAADLDPRDDVGGIDRGRHQPHLAVVEQQGMARHGGGEDFRMRQLGAGLVTRGRIRIEREGGAVLQRHRSAT